MRKPNSRRVRGRRFSVTVVFQRANINQHKVRGRITVYVLPL
jgi:hypothetical protein